MFDCLLWVESAEMLRVAYQMMRCADERSTILSGMCEIGGMRREADGGSGRSNDGCGGRRARISSESERLSKRAVGKGQLWMMSGIERGGKKQSRLIYRQEMRCSWRD